VGDAIPGAWYALLGKRWVATNQRFVAVPTPISFRHVLLFKNKRLRVQWPLQGALYFYASGLDGLTRLRIN
jgi:hypothetical protein